MALFDLDWMLRWQQVVNADLALKLIGKFFNAEIGFQFGEQRYRVSVKSGSIENVNHKNAIGSSWDFALTAPLEAWSKFIEKSPPPMYHDIWAMAKLGVLRMEGDMKKVWQNLRALTWMLYTMRLVG